MLKKDENRIAVMGDFNRQREKAPHDRFSPGKGAERLTFCVMLAFIYHNQTNKNMLTGRVSFKELFKFYLWKESLARAP